MMKRLNEERRERPCIQSWKYLVSFLLMFGLTRNFLGVTICSFL